MDLDEKRVESIFSSVLTADGPEEQVALLDRLCGEDQELRRRVQSRLQEHKDSATILATPAEVAQPMTSAGMLATEFASKPTKHIAAVSAQLRTESGHAAVDHEDPIELDFLQPSTMPGSLGRLNHHEVLEVLGKGGFGIVVRAFDENLQRVVAIKVLLPILASTSPARKRFLREARASARVRHANVVQIYAVEEQPLPYLVMEYIPGETLQHRLDQVGPLDVPDLLRIGGQIARGLAAAHEQGLIHRDIKPANILLESGVDQAVKITDFGLARAADDASLSQSGLIAGTPLYMAPEQAKGEPLDHRVDLFSLGSVLYTMTSGRPPFRAANTMAVLKRVAEDTPRPIREIIPEAPQWLCDLISKLHAKNPADRFQTAAEVATLLEQHLAHLQHPSQFAAPSRVRSPRRRTAPRAAVLSGGILLGSAVVAAITSPLWLPNRDLTTNAEQTADSVRDSQPPKPATPPTTPIRTIVLQGRGAVRDALIDFDETDTSFGSRPRENALRRADDVNALLVRFDLDRLDLPPKPRVVKAVVSFYVWDPSSVGQTHVCAFPLKTAWDEVAVTWREPDVNKSWKGNQGFAFEVDTGPPEPGVTVKPQDANDTEDPPIEYQLDVTKLVRSWLGGESPNYGIAIAPILDPSVDGGTQSRFQIYTSEHSQENCTPKLTLQIQP
jgi:serine/threonine protein kinase